MGKIALVCLTPEGISCFSTLPATAASILTWKWRFQNSNFWFIDLQQGEWHPPCHPPPRPLPPLTHRPMVICNDEFGCLSSFENISAHFQDLLLLFASSVPVLLGLCCYCGHMESSALACCSQARGVVLVWELSVATKWGIFFFWVGGRWAGNQSEMSFTLAGLVGGVRSAWSYSIKGPVSKIWLDLRFLYQWKLHILHVNILTEVYTHSTMKINWFSSRQNCSYTYIFFTLYI